MPVYNGQRFIRATLDSLLAQTFADFELIICDNASTDATEQICREYAERDARVRYHRNDRNLGPAPNYNRCFELSRGELFKWSAADDLSRRTSSRSASPSWTATRRLVGCYTRTHGDRRRRQGAVRARHRAEPRCRRASCDALASTRSSTTASTTRPSCGRVWRADGAAALDAAEGQLPQRRPAGHPRAVLHGPCSASKSTCSSTARTAQRSQTYLDKMKVRPGSRLVKWIGCGPLPSYEWWDATHEGQDRVPRVALGAGSTAVPCTRRRCASPKSWRATRVLAGLTVKFIPRLGGDVIIAAEQLFNRITGFGPKPAAPAAHPRQTPRHEVAW